MIFKIPVIEALSHKSMGVPVIYTSITEKNMSSEMIRSLVEIQMTEDLVHISITTNSDSSENLIRRDRSVPVIPANTCFSAEAKVPSVTFIDNDLMNFFLENLIACTWIEYDYTSGSSKLCVA